MAKHIVYVKDSDGSTLRMGEIVFNNSIVQHLPEFPCVDTVLKDIHDFPIRSDDIWILDFPKSGTNWLVSILGLLLNNQMKSVVTSKQESMLEFCPNLKTLETVPSPRVLNTHIRLCHLPRSLFENNKVIVMIRNPKSVAVSFYHHLKELPFYEYNGTFSGYLPHFMKGHCPDLYGNWFDYVVEIWEAFKNKQNVMFVFYEELKRDPVKTISHISEFLGLERDDDFIKDVANQTTIERLKEKQKELETERAFFVDVLFRKGSTSEWMIHFSEAQNKMFDEVYAEKMKDYPDLKERIQFS